MRSPTRRSAKVPLSPRPVSINRQGPNTGLPAAPASWTRRTSRLVSPLRSRAEPWPRGLRSAAMEGLSPLTPRRAGVAPSRGPQAHSDNINCILVCHVGVRTACSERAALAAPRLGSTPAPAPAQGGSEQLSSLACGAPADRLGRARPAASAHRLGRSSSPPPRLVRRPAAPTPCATSPKRRGSHPAASPPAGTRGPRPPRRAPCGALYRLSL